MQKELQNPKRSKTKVKKVKVMARKPKLMGVAGLKGVGKTFTTMKDIRVYVKGTPRLGVPPSKVLIFDVNNEFTEVKTIPLKSLRWFSAHPMAQARRVVPFDDEGVELSRDKKQDTLMFILKSFRGGLLLVEDMYNYTSDSMKTDLIGTLTSQRHKNLDIIVHSQGIGRLFNPKLVAQLHTIRMHLTQDHVSTYRKRIEEHYPILAITERLVIMKNSVLPKGKKYFYAYANLQDSLITGDFTKDELLKSIGLYISLHQSETINPLLKSKDRMGNFIYKNHSEAYDFLEQDLYDKFT